MKKLSPTSMIIIGLFIVIFSYALIKKYNRQNHPLFKGISKGITTGVKGNLTLDYVFTVDGEEIKGFVPSSFCNECQKCCIAGDTVIVRYENGNPHNSDLVTKLPPGELN